MHRRLLKRRLRMHSRLHWLTAMENGNLDMNSLNDMDLEDVVRQVDSACSKGCSSPERVKCPTTMHRRLLKRRLRMHSRLHWLTAMENGNLDMNSLNDMDLEDVVRWILPAAKVAHLPRDLGGKKDQHKNSHHYTYDMCLTT